MSKDESEPNNMNNLSYNLGQQNFENVVKKVPLMTSDIQESSYLRNKNKKGKYFFNMPTLNSDRNKGITEHIREDTKENEDTSQIQSGMFQEQQAQPKTFNELGNGTMLFSLISTYMESRLLSIFTKYKYIFFSKSTCSIVIYFLPSFNVKTLLL